jgi:hypothetical protein
MTVVKNGVGARWGEAHVYAGDKHKCLECGVEILNCNSLPSHDPKKTVETIQMDGN